MRGGEFCAREKSEHKDTQPLRYIAIRIRQRQESLFADGNKVKHFGVVTNIREWKAGRLIEWHREKAGTIEGVHDVVKNERAGGVMPSKYFGTNAAWLRLAVIAHNVMTALKRLALPAELLTARPKRLRFLIIHTPGRLVHHARQMVLRLATTAGRLAEWLEALGCCRSEYNDLGTAYRRICRPLSGGLWVEVCLRTALHGLRTRKGPPIWAIATPRRPNWCHFSTAVDPPRRRAATS
jgi:hypothetical protein